MQPISLCDGINSMKRLINLKLALALLLVVIYAGASQVTFLPLEKVITKDTIIFEGVIDSLVVQHTRDSSTVVIRVRDLTSLQGDKPRVNSLRYTMIVPVWWDSLGNVILTYSPILKASGDEFQLKQGDACLFFTDPDQMEQNMLSIFRVEHADRKDRVIELIREVQKGKKEE